MRERGDGGSERKERKSTAERASIRSSIDGYGNGWEEGGKREEGSTGRGRIEYRGKGINLLYDFTDGASKSAAQS